MKNKKEKVYAFIDSNNLYLAIKSCGWKLDFARFYIYLRDKYKVEKSFIFIGYLPGNESLYTYLQKIGYIVVFKPTLFYRDKDGNKRVKGNVDAELVLHAMIEYPNYDKAIIVTGDGDFYCLVEYLEKQGKLGRLLIPNRKNYSRLLWKFRKYMDFVNYLERKVRKRQK